MGGGVGRVGWPGLSAYPASAATGRNLYRLVRAIRLGQLGSAPGVHGPLRWLAFYFVWRPGQGARRVRW